MNLSKELLEKLRDAQAAMDIAEKSLVNVCGEIALVCDESAGVKEGSPSQAGMAWGGRRAGRRSGGGPAPRRLNGDAYRPKESIECAVCRARVPGVRIVRGVRYPYRHRDARTQAWCKGKHQPGREIAMPPVRSSDSPDKSES